MCLSFYKLILLLNNFDSFTYIIADYFNQLGVACKVLNNDADLVQIIKPGYKAIVLSPGPGVPVKHGVIMKVIDHYHKKLPILGICLGYQAIGQYFGAELVKSKLPMHGKISEIVTTAQNDIIFNGLPKRFNVVRYHSLELKNIPPVLQAIAHTTDGDLMAINHVTLPIWGLQFHPEAVLTEFGLQMLKNWVTFNNITA